MKIGTYETHPVADIFPLIDGAEFTALAADIKANGLRHPIVLNGDGLILDGRNRLKACLYADVQPHFTQYQPANALTYVLSLNLHRRHLDASQLGMVAARIATLKNGQRQLGQLAEVPTQAEAAVMLNVGEQSVRRARDVIDSGIPELADAVERGDVAVSAAAEVAAMPKEEVRALVAKGGKAVAAKAKERRESKRETKLRDESAHLLIAVGALKDSIRAIAARWPDAQRRHVPGVLRDLADELEREAMPRVVAC